MEKIKSYEMIEVTEDSKGLSKAVKEFSGKIVGKYVLNDLTKLGSIPEDGVKDLQEGLALIGSAEKLFIKMVEQMDQQSKVMFEMRDTIDTLKYEIDCLKEELAENKNEKE